MKLKKMVILFITLILFSSFSMNMSAGNEQASVKKITGTVKDAGGEAVIGANVVVKGTTNGTITDVNGDYSLEGVPSNGILLISYIGYLTREEPVNNRTQITIVLMEDTKMLDEVVVVGYGTMRKSDVTGSIGVAKGDELTKTQSFSALENLRGKVSGVNIFSNSSQPGAYSNRVIIRGMATINSSSDPPAVCCGWGSNGRLRIA